MNRERQPEASGGQGLSRTDRQPVSARKQSLRVRRHDSTFAADARFSPHRHRCPVQRTGYNVAENCQNVMVAQRICPSQQRPDAGVLSSELP